MVRYLALGCFLCAALLSAQTLVADSKGVALLSAAVEAGVLEVVTGDIVELSALLDSERAGLESYQSDAVVFLLEGITVNDLNGDGRGFRLGAVAEPLAHTSGGMEAILPVGTIGGFRNPSESEGVVLPNPSELLYERGKGIEGFQVDYEIAFDVPEQSPEGMYSGLLRLELSAL